MMPSNDLFSAVWTARIPRKGSRRKAEPERLYPALLQFAQTVAKVCSMQYYKREVIQYLSYEQLAEFVE